MSASDFSRLCWVQAWCGHMFIPVHIPFGYSLGVKNYTKCLCVVNWLPPKYSEWELPDSRQHKMTGEFYYGIRIKNIYVYLDSWNNINNSTKPLNGICRCYWIICVVHQTAWVWRAHGAFLLPCSRFKSWVWELLKNNQSKKNPTE